MELRSLVTAIILVACVKACCPHVECAKCEPVPPPPPPPAGGLGIPYKPCTLPGQCSEAALAASGLDPGNNLNARANVCESNWCRAYYDGATSVCLDGDQIKCAKSNGVFGVATCATGSYGACL
jgi:hypothetical protein